MGLDDDDDTLKASVRMFVDLDLLDKFRINYEVMTMFGTLDYFHFKNCIHL